ncbi:MAG: signal peptide peptidase SppA [Anaerolineales bacterium]
MSSEMPVSPAAPGPTLRSAGAWRTLLALLIGFALPVLACYGLILTSAVALQILSLGSRPSFTTTSRGSGPAVALIRVEGVIMSGESLPFATGGTAGAATIIEQITRANEDSDVEAIVLAVDSPGGGVNAADRIYHELKGVEKPIVVMMGDVAASGGYYISMASDWIVANPNTLTGSIGVISEFPNAAELLDKVGVEFVVITSGPRKDIGSPYREMTDEERVYWQAMVDEIYESFVLIVAEGRQMAAEQVRPLADGSVYTGRQALALGLVDQVGYEADAIAKAAELGGIQGEPRIIEYQERPTFLDLLAQAAAERSLVPSVAEIMDLLGHPSISARWIGP